MRVVAGLGNPGPDYAWTRHNIGFMVVNTIAKRWHVPLRACGATMQGSRVVDAEEIRLLLPQTYMNRSGDALEGVVRDASATSLVVVYDDVDLPVGALRIRRNGGAGGHLGMASVIEACGTDFVRVRIGVGRPPNGTTTADYVLAPLSADEREEMTEGIERGADAVECILTDGVELAMNRFNRAQANARDIGF